MSGVDDGAAWWFLTQRLPARASRFPAKRAAHLLSPGGSDQKPGHFFNRLLRRRQTNPLQRSVHQSSQSLHAQGQMRPAAVAHHGMNLIDDQGAHGAEHLAARGRREEQIKGLRGCYQDVRRLSQDGPPLRGWRLARAHFRAHVNQPSFAGQQRGANTGQWFLQVFVNVVAQGLKRRDVEHMGLVPEFSRQALAKQVIERCQKRGEGLARSRRRGNQGMPARLNRRPTQPLGFGWRAELRLEPPRDGGME